MRTLIAFLLSGAFVACATKAPEKKPAPEVPLLAVEPVQELTLAKPLQTGRGAFVTAASGIVVKGGTIFLVADDELAIFSLKAGGKVSAHALTARSLPADAKARKAEKADFESLLSLSEKEWPPHGALVAWPSASKKTRVKAYVVPFNRRGAPGKAIEHDVTALRERMKAETKGLNVEGLFVRDGVVQFAQRGNSKKGRNGFFEMPLESWLAGMKTGEWMGGVLQFRAIEMGELGGVKLALTDAVSTEAGVFGLAAAEATDSAYDDGSVVGSVLVKIVDGKARTIGVFPPALKLEGLAVEKIEADGSMRLLLVDDADDPAKPSTLYRVVVPGAAGVIADVPSHAVSGSNSTGETQKPPRMNAGS